MARINLNEFGGQAGGLAYRANQVRTDPVVVEAAKVALGDVRSASRSCSVLAREAAAAWQRTRPAATTATTPAQPAHSPQPAHSEHVVTSPSALDPQDRPTYRAAS